MLQLHRAERTDRLADALADVMAVPLADPFAAEVVAVPARGIERWLTQRLSHRLGAGTSGDGVCANVEFPSPAAVVVDAIEAGSGISRGEDPWRPDRLVWPLLDVIDECAGEPWCATLGRYIGAQPQTPQSEREFRLGRRYATAAKLAGLFTSYGAQRPGMLRAWAIMAAGPPTDGGGDELDEDSRWQATLWRRLRNRVGVASPAERLAAAGRELLRNPDVSDLPPRLSVFGPTRLTVDQLTVLGSLGAHREVHLFVPHPSPALWQAMGGLHGTVSAAVPAGTPPRRHQLIAPAVGHPLLASLGRDTRELQLVLIAGAPDAVDRHHDRAHPPGEATTLLARLQDGIHASSLPPPGERPELDPGDRSITIHACHGRSRQVEVLREVVLGLLTEDPSLEPRDILVMCPDIETFAPLISAAFGLGHGNQGVATHPGHQLRVRLADRSLRQTNPVLAVVASLLELADARVTATAVLGLAAMTPVRQRFGFDVDELERLRQWVVESGVRWGLDDRHRQAIGGLASLANTWRAGLDRVLVGVAMTPEDQRYLGVALPLEDVDGADIALAGRFAELLDRLAGAVRSLSAAQPLPDWLAAISAAVDGLTDVAEVDAWQLTQARRELAEPMQAMGSAEVAAPPVLRLDDIRALLRDRLAGRPSRANFRTGDLTVCSLVPMRSVPHRVVCLLGMDDGVLAHGSGDGDDLLLADPVVGERDRRSEARQMVLDAVLAATQRLVVVYTGADERTGALLPPAVPIGELLDTADVTCRVAVGEVSDRIVVRHPLQPYDVRNFIDGALGGTAPFSFDANAVAGARAAGTDREPAPAFLAGPLPPPERTELIELGDLIGFLEHPVRRFLRSRLRVTLDRGEQELSDAIPVALTPLETWGVGERLLQARTTGSDQESARAAEFRRGHLPPGALGYRALEAASAQVEPLVAAAEQLRSGPAATVDVTVDLPDGRRLVGTVPGVHAAGSGPTVVRVVYSRLGPKHRLRAWAQLLALASWRPGEPWRAVTAGRNPISSRRGSAVAKSSTFEAAAVDDALQELLRLVDLYDRGMREPLPMALATSHAYAAAVVARATMRDAVSAAEAEWLKWSESTMWGEAMEAEHILVWGEAAPLDRLRDARPLSDETGGAWPVDNSRFGVLALRLWTGLLAAERTELL